MNIQGRIRIAVKIGRIFTLAFMIIATTKAITPSIITGKMEGVDIRKRRPGIPMMRRVVTRKLRAVTTATQFTSRHKNSTSYRRFSKTWQMSALPRLLSLWSIGRSLHRVSSPFGLLPSGGRSLWSAARSICRFSACAFKISLFLALICGTPLFGLCCF